MRDCILGTDSKDIDIECFGHYTFSRLIEWLAEWGRVEVVGKSFAVCKLHLPSGNVLDISVPRHKERRG